MTSVSFTACSFCRREAEQVAEGPAVSICERCIDDALGHAGALPVEGRCSFCRNATEIRAVDAANDVRICSGCLSFAREIVDHQRASAPGAL